MLTRREKLLIRPWQLRRYNNHKKKVVNAVSVVDFGPPHSRGHVTVKLKKLQKERERQYKIKEDNFKLLQNLGSIMSSKRVDNYWKEEPPTFLKRVGIYPKSRAPTPSYEITLNDTQENSTRKLRCLACTPHEKKNIIIPEERVPWEEPKKMLTRRLSALAIFPLTSTFNPSKEKTEVNLKDPKSSLKYKKKSLAVSGENFKFPTLEIANTKSTNFQEVKQKVVLQVGQSQITLNFPPFAEVKFVEGKCEKYLQRNSCGCKRLNSLRQNVLDSKIKS